MTGDDLKAFRKARGLSTERLALMTGMSVSAIQKQEAGQNPVPKSTAIIIRAYQEERLPHDWPERCEG